MAPSARLGKRTRAEAFGLVGPNAKDTAPATADADPGAGALPMLHCADTRHTIQGRRIMSDELVTRVRDIMSDVFDLDELHITRETTAEDIEEWDSLSHIRLVVAVERAFGVKFSNSEIEGLANVGELVDVIKQKL
ncbi:acyl carrier protein [Sphingomonas sp.]|uniref:acyl carrier protein n=1 Tax=Sphingomonas sp. TaxID=28214 RepID=UPI0025D4950E|nr:acyl carrier protein [Sphingomonas sp.]